LLGKYDLGGAQVLRLTSLQLAKEILRKGEAVAVLDDFERLRRDLSTNILHLKEKIAREDPTVAELLEGASRKMHYQLEKVYRRFVLNHRSHQGHRRGHVAYLGSHLLPRNVPQERVVNFNTFLVREGAKLVDQVVAKVDPETVAHQLLYL